MACGGNRGRRQVIHYGDIGDIDGSFVEPVDVVVGGSPCQDLSVAGRRAGMVKRCVCGYETAALSAEETCPICGSALTKTRSALFAEQIRIVREMRDGAKGKYPRYMLWENVSGALTSNKGEDFRAVLTRTAQVADPDAVIPEPPAGKWPHAGHIMGDGWSIAWRLVDAQYWGVTITDGDTGDVLRMGTPPNAAAVSHLSQISKAAPPGSCSSARPAKPKLRDVLEPIADPKYTLTPAACLGILRRMEKRGKTPPEIMLRVLRRQAGLSPTV